MSQHLAGFLGKVVALSLLFVGTAVVQVWPHARCDDGRINSATNLDRWTVFSNAVIAGERTGVIRIAQPGTPPAPPAPAPRP
jgi:hypothetical protein